MPLFIARKRAGHKRVARRWSTDNTCAAKRRQRALSTLSLKRALNDDRKHGPPLGPDSLTWKYFGDLRTGTLGVSIGAIQNMYPELGAGVDDHSILLREPLQRVARYRVIPSSVIRCRRTESGAHAPPPGPPIGCWSARR